MAARRTARDARRMRTPMAGPYRRTTTEAKAAGWLVGRGPILWWAADRRRGRTLSKYLTPRWIVKHSTNSRQWLMSSFLSPSHIRTTFHTPTRRKFVKISITHSTLYLMLCYDRVVMYCYDRVHLSLIIYKQIILHVGDIDYWQRMMQIVKLVSD